MAAKKKPAVAPEPAPAIPSAAPVTIPISPALPAKTLSLEERMAAKAGKKPATTTAAAKDWRITLAGERQQELALTLTSGTHGQKVLEGQVKTARTELQPELIRLIATEWNKQQRQADNPVVVAPGCQFRFVVAEASNMVLKSRTKNVNIEEVLTKHGLAPAVQRKIVQDFTTQDVFSVNTETAKSENPALYEKIISLLLRANEEGIFDAQGNEVLRLSDEEFGAVVSSDKKVNIAEGFLDRLPKYAAEAGNNSVDQLVSAMNASQELGILTWKVTGVTVNDPEPTIDRMIRGTSSATPAKQGFKTSDGKFYIEANNNEVVCYALPQAPGQETKVVFRKTCAGGASHAVNTAKALVESPHRLAEEIASAK